jgi:hypothetical protein
MTGDVGARHAHRHFHPKPPTLNNTSAPRDVKTTKHHVQLASVLSKLRCVRALRNDAAGVKTRDRQFTRRRVLSTPSQFGLRAVSGTHIAL